MNLSAANPSVVPDSGAFMNGGSICVIKQVMLRLDLHLSIGVDTLIQVRFELGRPRFWEPWPAALDSMLYGATLASEDDKFS